MSWWVATHPPFASGPHVSHDLCPVLFGIEGERSLRDLEREDIGERAAGLHDIGRETIHLDVALVAEHKLLVAVEQAEALRHMRDGHSQAPLLPAQAMIDDGEDHREAKCADQSDRLKTLPSIENSEHV
jgi:hypothetical protein